MRTLTNEEYRIVYRMAMTDFLLAEVLGALAFIRGQVPLALLAVALVLIVLWLGPKASRL